MNLLPSTEKEILKKGLKLRFVVVSMILLAASFLVGLVMLLPSYFMVFGYFSETNIKNYSPETEDEESVKKILNLPQEINSKVKLLQSNVDNVSITGSVSEIIGYLPEKIKLNSISFAKNKNASKKEGVSILLSGIASDRDSLVSFSTLLKESKSFSSVDVPVSSLTKEKNLPFSVSIFIENKK